MTQNQIFTCPGISAAYNSNNNEQNKDLHSPAIVVFSNEGPAKRNGLEYPFLGGYD